ncbi:unnamed protein product [Gulo gulo]|uniref:Uncharacterized protein n=1 Tax=Gulo gulo TaxID=48420 RepID=A0A9X9PUU7_GULGU|nr:unnamed protein product [Gulo gulo]
MQPTGANHSGPQTAKAGRGLPVPTAAGPLPSPSHNLAPLRHSDLKCSDQTSGWRP